MVRKPGVLDLDSILRLAPIEERVYRMRCVEGWSIVIPWNGFSLSKLLNFVEPLSAAKYVAFTTLLGSHACRTRSVRVGLALRRGIAGG